jgi:hypothetical protein
LVENGPLPMLELVLLFKWSGVPLSHDSPILAYSLFRTIILRICPYYPKYSYLGIKLLSAIVAVNPII